jgi:hypothetical protein
MTDKSSKTPFSSTYAYLNDHHLGDPIAFPCSFCERTICAYGTINFRDATERVHKLHGDRTCYACGIELDPSDRHRFECSLKKSQLVPNLQIARPKGKKIKNFTIAIQGEGYDIGCRDDIKKEDHIALYRYEIQMREREVNAVLNFLAAASRLDRLRLRGSSEDIEYFKVLAKIYSINKTNFAVVFQDTLFYLYLEAMMVEKASHGVESLEVARILHERFINAHRITNFVLDVCKMINRRR